ncbi:MAG: hypothetical protein Q7T86_17775 [Hyphomicrobiaceae bacterium]|nr:hypothetical protein [Hyphomicrobiaceae bacterium]
MSRKLALATALALAIALSAGGSAALTPAAEPDAGPEPSQAQKEVLAAAPEHWPMKIDEFLAKEYLTRADVVLTRRDYDPTSFAIRWATDSPYSHAALVFNRPRQETGISSTFVIEAGSSGVDLTNLRDYISDKSSFIAIKRFRKEWFDEEMQGRVRGVLLEKIKDSYNYWAIGRIARNLWFGVQTATRRNRERSVQAYKDNEWKPPSEFICSGLVQIGFVEATIEGIKAGRLPPRALRDVVFLQRQRRWLPNENGWKRLDRAKARDTAVQFRQQNLAALESITPEDLARSEKLEWLYVIKNNMVYKVTSYDQAKALIEDVAVPVQDIIPTPEKPSAENIPPPLPATVEAGPTEGPAAAPEVQAPATPEPPAVAPEAASEPASPEATETAPPEPATEPASPEPEATPPEAAPKNPD